MGQLCSLIYMNPPKPTSSSIDGLTDEEIYTLIANRRDEDVIGVITDVPKDIWRDSVVHRIADDAVVKAGRMPEAIAMSYVSSHTSIPIPRVRRVLRPSPLEEGCWIVMDLIDGETLDTVWGKLSWWGRLVVVLHMRQYIRQLQKIPLPNPNFPGPFSSSGEPIKCEGIFFTNAGTPPFNSYNEMADWFDCRRFEAMAYHHRDTGQILQCDKFDRTQPLVVCHMDLHLRNIIIDRKGIPWLIDWAQAGAYPAWLEYAKATLPAWEHPRLWQRCCTFIFGDYQKYYESFLYPLGGILTSHMPRVPLDYFSSRGIEVD